jgi:hypothetical protein
MHPLRHPRMLLGGDLHKRLFRLSQSYQEIPTRGPMYGLLPPREVGYFLHKKTGVHTCIKIT